MNDVQDSHRFGGALTRSRGIRAWFLPLAGVFGLVTFVLLPLGQSAWIVTMPLAATFAILGVRTRDEGESDEDVEDAST